MSANEREEAIDAAVGALAAGPVKRLTVSQSALGAFPMAMQTIADELTAAACVGAHVFAFDGLCKRYGISVDFDRQGRVDMLGVSRLFAVTDDAHRMGLGCVCGRWMVR